MVLFVSQAGSSIDSSISRPYTRINTAASTVRPSYNYSFDKLPRKTWIDGAREKASPKKQGGAKFFHFLQGQPVQFSSQDDE
jgi:hypothetical protein